MGACRRFFLIAALLLPMFQTVDAHSAPRENGCLPLRSSSSSTLSFKSGEKLVFTAHYKWGPVNADVAKVNISVDSTKLNGNSVYHVRLSGQTVRVFDMFFKVREDFQSWFTCEDLLPVKFVRSTYEGNYVCTNNYLYVRDAAEPYIAAGIYSSKRGEYTANIPLTECTYDLPSLFFMARNIDFSKITEGKNYPMTFAIDDDVYTIRFIYRRTETLKVPGVGNVRCRKFSVGVVSGKVFDGSADISLWVSDDDNRIPVLFETPIKPGEVSGRLISWSGLKYPFKALE